MIVVNLHYIVLILDLDLVIDDDEKEQEIWEIGFLELVVIKIMIAIDIKNFVIVEVVRNIIKVLEVLVVSEVVTNVSGSGLKKIVVVFFKDFF